MRATVVLIGRTVYDDRRSAILAHELQRQLHLLAASITQIAIGHIPLVVAARWRFRISCKVIVGYLLTAAHYTGQNGMDHQLDMLLRLDTHLRTLILRAIIIRWQAGEHEISSQDLYS